MAEAAAAPATGAIEAARLDRALPFSLERVELHGRVVRLGPALDRALDGHAYPDAVAVRLAELMTLGAALAGSLKFEGVFTLEVRGDGPLSLMVADCRADGGVRGYACCDLDALEGIDEADFAQIVGVGRLAITVDQSVVGGETYQSVVALEGGDLASCMRDYFRASDQLRSALALAADRDPETGAWRGGALLLQSLPDEVRAKKASDELDAWREAMLLMETLEPQELLDADLPLAHLLFRLFHEFGVRVYEPRAFRHHCTCNAERMAAMLARFSLEERREMAQDGAIEVGCQFCGAVRRFDADDLALEAATPGEAADAQRD